MNLALIALDTLRADHLGCYGYHRDTSPFLDSFARRGVLFERYFATTIPTHPSFTTVFTGMDAFGHQITNVQGDNELSPDIPVLAEVLRDAGFQTAAVDTMGRWMSRGFQVYENPKYNFFGEPSYDCGYGRRRKDKNFGAAITRKAREVLAGIDKSKPFFFFCHYWDPHQPYFPPAPYHRLYYQGDPTDPRHMTMPRTWAFRCKTLWVGKWIDEAVRDAEYWVAQYDGEINYTDDQVKALLAEMETRGLWDDTLVVIFSDHGEIMYEHPGEFDHEGLYDADVHVPLLMRFPGDPYAGTRVPAMTTNLDVMPTILDLLKVKAPATVEGSSLMPLARSEKSEFRHEIYLGEGNWQCKRGVRTHEWKFIRALSNDPLHNWHADPVKELYHLPDDPWEQTNLANVRPRAARELERRLDGYLAECEKRYGHRDPIEIHGPTFGRKGLDEAEKLDAAGEIR
ncbi:MAG: sulfatase [Candidatus Sumerlaeota bacterium]|nr:sulfatase [Candidatus Sumerlaeota bacterium]